MMVTHSLMMVNMDETVFQNVIFTTQGNLGMVTIQYLSKMVIKKWG
jgi:hypothetical protein